MRCSQSRASRVPLRVALPVTTIIKSLTLLLTRSRKLPKTKTEQLKSDYFLTFIFDINEEKDQQKTPKNKRKKE